MLIKCENVKKKKKNVIDTFSWLSLHFFHLIIFVHLNEKKKKRKKEKRAVF